jgi:hypothetical protein
MEQLSSAARFMEGQGSEAIERRLVSIERELAALQDMIVNENRPAEVAGTIRPSNQPRGEADRKDATT